MDSRPIGVFDSGLGGLTVVKELMRRLPSEHIIYFGDTGRVPYGTRGEDTIRRYTEEDVQFLQRFDVKLIIVACGTASSVLAGDEAYCRINNLLRVIDPAVAAATSRSRSGRIGVIGTEATIRTGVYREKILKARPGAQVYSRGCPMFVPLVENGYIGRDCRVTRWIAEEYLSDFSATGIDTLILGCTHYPLIAQTIRDVIGEEVELINVGAETVREAGRILKERDAENTSQTRGKVSFFVSDNPDLFAKTGALFLESSLEGRVEQIPPVKEKGTAMKKDVMITIRGTRYADGESDTVELFTEGTYYFQEGKCYITYKETEDTGMLGTTTMLKIEGEDRVTLSRKGTMRSQLVIERGKRHLCHYGTEDFEMQVGILAGAIRSKLRENGGDLYFEYSLDVNTSLESEHEVEIHVKECNGGDV